RRRPRAPRDVRLGRTSGAGRLAGGALGGALRRNRVLAGEHHALVADDVVDLLVGEDRAPRRHARLADALPTGTVRVAVGLSDVGLRARLHERDLVLDVGEGLQHRAVAQLEADAPGRVAGARGQVARRAVRGVERLAR